MALSKRTYSIYKKVVIFGSGTLAAFLALISATGLFDISTSEDIYCGTECVSYFNITASNYSLCFGSTFKGVYLEGDATFELYKADLRYRYDNPNRWKPFNLTKGVCLDRGKTHEFKLIGHKKPEQTIKWGVQYGVNQDPFWYGETAESILWENTKKVTKNNITITAPKDFTTCTISPDGGDGWDNCTAYIEACNNRANFTGNNINLSAKFDKPANIRNIDLSFTDNMTEEMQNITYEINETDNGTYSQLIKTFYNLNSTKPPMFYKGKCYGIKADFQKTRWASVSFNFSAKAGVLETLLDPDVSACGNLNTANSIYTLNQSVSSAGTCFNILANNVTLDGAGYTVNYSQSAGGYGINNTLGYNFTTIKNANIVKGSTSSNSYAIYFKSASNGTIQDNTITTSGTSGYGVYLQSSSKSNSIANNTITTSGTSGWGVYLQSSSNSNNFTNNTITTSGSSGYGVYLQSSSNSNNFTNNAITTTNTSGFGFYILASSNNSITGGSIIAQKSYDYYIDLDTESNINNFTGTNFTARRWIYFQDTSTWFNYRNDSSNNLWLKTKAGISGRHINRTLATWNNNVMKWNETPSFTFTATYNITGLLASTTYEIYNTSSGTQTNPYTLATDSAGTLPSFTIALNGNTEIIVNTSVGDSLNPLYSLNSTNSTIAGASVKHSLYWTDETALSGYIFSFDNGTGTFANDSFVLMTGTGNWSNVTKSVNATVSSTIRWFVWANDTSNNANQSVIYSYLTTAAPSDSCTCPAINTNWEIDLTDNCILYSNCDLGSGNLTWINTGTFTINATLNIKNISALSNGQIIYIKQFGLLNGTFR